MTEEKMFKKGDMVKVAYGHLCTGSLTMDKRYKVQSIIKSPGGVILEISTHKMIETYRFYAFRFDKLTITKYL
jgi:hypothetical protein